MTFTAKDLADPSRQLPRAMAIAIGLATIVYVAVALGVFGTLTVEEVIDSGATAIAVAAQPELGDFGYVLMSITALFATAGATNAGLYLAAGLSDHLASTEQFPPFMGRRLADRASVGLLAGAAAILLLVIAFDLTAIASIGSAVAMTIFGLVTVGHLRIYKATGARLSLLVLALLTVSISLLTFILTTLIQEPASIATLVAILIGSIAIDVWWARVRARRAEAAAEPSA